MAEYITKDKMKSGQVAVLENGDVTMVLKHGDIIYLVDKKGYSSQYDPFMSCSISEIEFQGLRVAKLYDTSPAYWVHVFMDNDVDLPLDKGSWLIRDTGLISKKPKKLTLKEIEERLGYEIELLED